LDKSLQSELKFVDFLLGIELELGLLEEIAEIVLNAIEVGSIFAEILDQKNIQVGLDLVDILIM
jgi:hypothetical protein